MGYYLAISIYYESASAFTHKFTRQLCRISAVKGERQRCPNMTATSAIGILAAHPGHAGEANAGSPDNLDELVGPPELDNPAVSVQLSFVASPLTG
jgi:hypothetical protein